MEVESTVTGLIAFASVKEAESKIFLRVKPEVKAGWLAMCQERRINQTKAGESLVEWVTAQEPIVQAMVLGQVPVSPDLMREAMERAAEAERLIRKGGQSAAKVKPPGTTGKSGTSDRPPRQH